MSDLKYLWIFSTLWSLPVSLIFFYSSNLKKKILKIYFFFICIPIVHSINIFPFRKFFPLIFAIPLGFWINSYMIWLDCFVEMVWDIGNLIRSIDDSMLGSYSEENKIQQTLQNIEVIMYNIFLPINLSITSIQNKICAKIYWKKKSVRSLIKNFLQNRTILINLKSRLYYLHLFWILSLLFICILK